MTPLEPPKKLKRSRAILKPIEGFIKEIRNTIKEIRMWQIRLRAAQIAQKAPRNTPMPELTEQEAHILQALQAQGVGKAP